MRRGEKANSDRLSLQPIRDSTRAGRQGVHNWLERLPLWRVRVRRWMPDLQEAPIGTPIPKLELPAPAVSAGTLLFACCGAGPAHGSRIQSAGAVRVPREAMLEPARVCGSALMTAPDNLSLPVFRLVEQPVVHAPKMVRIGGAVSVRSLHLLKDQGKIRAGSRCLLPSPVPVRDGSNRMRTFPQVRKSMDLLALSEAEREGFLHEAAQRPGGEAAERVLLAVFQRVPAERVSRLRYHEPTGQLVFTAVPDQRATHLRLFDLGVAVNKTHRKTEIFVHRTRCTTVRLR